MVIFITVTNSTNRPSYIRVTKSHAWTPNPSFAHILLVVWTLLWTGSKLRKRMTHFFLPKGYTYQKYAWSEKVSSFKFQQGQAHYQKEKLVFCLQLLIFQSRNNTISLKDDTNFMTVVSEGQVCAISRVVHIRSLCEFFLFFHDYFTRKFEFFMAILSTKTASMCTCARMIFWLENGTMQTIHHCETKQYYFLELRSAQHFFESSKLTIQRTLAHQQLWSVIIL